MSNFLWGVLVGAVSTIAIILAIFFYYMKDDFRD